MRKGTTPTLIFKLPFEVEMLKNAKVTLCQKDAIVLEKKLCDCKKTQDSISITLTQEETFRFDCNSIIEAQLRVVTINGDALASDVFKIFVAQCLDNEVIE